MPRTSPFLQPLRKMGKSPRLSTRARKVRVNYNPEYLPPVQSVLGMNQWESRVALALEELKITYQPQAAFGGGNTVGGSRADFLLPDYRVVILVNGPFHDTTYGRARDVLAEFNYQAAGLRIERIYGSDFSNLKPRLLELLGSPIGGQ